MSPRPTDPLSSDLDLNCDLGEHESRERAVAMLARVDSANIACGAHAGTDASMGWCLAEARRLGVRAGAHPGFPSRADFGRGAGSRLSVDALGSLLEEQVGRLAAHAAACGVTLHHVKLHGALYHAVEHDPELARAYLHEVGRRWAGLRIYARAGGAVERERRRASHGVEVWAEGFLDRGYRDDGTLVPRGEPGALLDEPSAVLARWEDFRERGGCRTVSGAWLALRPRTVCVHGDGPRSLEILDALRRVKAEGRLR